MRRRVFLCLFLFLFGLMPLLNSLSNPRTKRFMGLTDFSSSPRVYASGWDSACWWADESLKGNRAGDNFSEV